MLAEIYLIFCLMFGGTTCTVDIVETQAEDTVVVKGTSGCPGGICKEGD